MFGGKLSGLFLFAGFFLGFGVFSEMHALVAFIAWRRVLGGKRPGADAVLLGFGLGLGAEDLFVGVDDLLGLGVDFGVERAFEAFAFEGILAEFGQFAFAGETLFNEFGF